MAEAQTLFFLSLSILCKLFFAHSREFSETFLASLLFGIL